MGGGGSPRHANPAGRYLPGLCAAGLGLCAAGWLVLTPFAFGYRGTSHGATLTDLATGSVLAAVCLVTLVAWDAAWRRAMWADGVLSRPPGGPSRARRRRACDGAASPAPDPDQVLTALRALLTQPAVAVGPASAAAGPAGSVGHPPAPAAPAGSVIPEPRNRAEPANGTAVIESMTAGAAPLLAGHENESMTAGAAPLLPGYEDEETW